MVEQRQVELRDAIQAAALRAEVVGAVEQLYAQVQAAIDQRRPVCEMSGRCCRFEEYGHRLYVSTIELAAFVKQASGARRREADDGGCPFQQNKLCTVHPIRPLGCRMFFCDPSSSAWQNQAYEQFHARIKALHEGFGIPYYYVEWREGLRALSEAKSWF